MTPEDNPLEMLRSQLLEIKDVVKGIDHEVTDKLGKFAEQFKDFSVVIGTVMVRIEERDKRYQEISVDNKDTFNRFGNEITESKRRIHELEMQAQRIPYLEKVIYGTSAATGGLLIMFIKKSLGL